MPHVQFRYAVSECSMDPNLTSIKILNYVTFNFLFGIVRHVAMIVGEKQGNVFIEGLVMAAVQA